MRALRLYVLAIWALIAAQIPGATAQPHLAGFNDAEIAWTDLETGLARAKAEDKQVFVLVHATWCHICRAYRQVFDDPEIVARAQDYVFVLVDMDKEPAASARYAPDGEYVPRSMVLRPDGTLRADLHSGRDDFRYFLNSETPEHLALVLSVGLKFPG